MANSIAKLAILLTTDTSGMTRGFSDGKQKTIAFAAGINDLTVGLGKAAAGFFTLAAAGKTITWMGKLAAESERLKVTLAGLVGGQANAASVLSDLQSFPLFDLQDANAAARTLLATGTQVKDLRNELTILADIAAGSGNSLGLMADMLAKVQTDGRLAEGELTMFAKNGIPLQDQLAKQLGVTRDRVRELADQGRISSYEVKRAMELMTREGGAFANANQKALATASGQWSQFQDNLSTNARLGGEFGLNPFTSAMSFLNATLAGGDPFKKIRESQRETIQTTDSLGNSITKFYSQVAGDRVTLKIIDAKQSEAVGVSLQRLEEMRRHMEAIQARGDSLTNSLRNPAEIFADTLREAGELLKYGVITAETYARAQGKAKEHLLESLQAARQLRDVQREGSVGAASRNTAAGISQVFQAGAELRRLEQLNRQQLQRQDEANRLLKEANDLAKQRKPQVTINTVGNF